ncbi:MAG TPA: SRPBCC family protein [Galbitalea sp.]|nr:SRPBCC family protein [Galbitalea sp.]
MANNLVATASVSINASRDRVWDALTDPEIIARYMFGSRVTSDWKIGSPITYAGEYEGKEYEDHGTILEVKPGELLRSTHFSPLSGKPDLPENYHTITYTLDAQPHGMHLELSQDNNSSEAEVEHSAANWQQMLDSLKTVVESTP